MAHPLVMSTRYQEKMAKIKAAYEGKPTSKAPSAPPVSSKAKKGKPAPKGKLAEEISRLFGK